MRSYDRMLICFLATAFLVPNSMAIARDGGARLGWEDFQQDKYECEARWFSEALEPRTEVAWLLDQWIRARSDLNAVTSDYIEHRTQTLMKEDSEPLLMAAYAWAVRQRDLDAGYFWTKVGRHAVSHPAAQLELESLRLRKQRRSSPGARIQVDRISDLLVETCQMPRLEDGDQRIIFHNQRQTIDTFMTRAQASSCLRQLAESASPDPWLVDMFRGALELKLAWDERGNGWTHTVTDEGWEGFARHLASAYEHLHRAHTARPEWPEAATLMIPIAMAGHTPEGEDEYYWFNETRRKYAAWPPALTRLYYANRPRWGGSYEGTIQFGLWLADQAEYETYAPFALIQALTAIKDGGENERLTEYWGDSEVMAAMRQLSDGYVRVRGSSNQVSKNAASVAAAIAVYANEPKQCAEIVRSINLELQQHRVRSLHLSVPEVMEFAALGSIDSVDTARNVTDRLEIGDIEGAQAALAFLAESCSQVSADDPYLPVLTDIVHRLDRATGLAAEFTETAWTPIPTDALLTDWMPLEGLWMGDSMGVSVTHGRQSAAAILAAPLPENFELKVSIAPEVLDPKMGSQMYCGVAFTRALHDKSARVALLSNDLRVLKVVLPGWDRDIHGFIDPNRRSRPESLRMTIQRFDRRLAILVNGETVKRIQLLDTEDSGRHMALMSGNEKSATTRFFDIRVRALSEPTPEMLK